MGIAGSGKRRSRQIVVSKDCAAGEPIIAFIEKRLDAAQETERTEVQAGANATGTFSLRPSFQSQTFPLWYFLMTRPFDWDRATRVLRAEAIPAPVPDPSCPRRSWGNPAAGALSINQVWVARWSRKPPPYPRAGIALDRPSCSRKGAFHIRWKACCRNSPRTENPCSPRQ